MPYSLSVIIPVYNEERTIMTVLDSVWPVELIKDGSISIIVVDDCSTDSTAKVIRDYIKNHAESRIEYCRHDVNQGKGAAIHTGLRMARGDYIIIQDADLEYDPQEYNLLLDPILRGFADVVYGSRFAGGKPHRALFFWHTIGNKFLTLVSNIFTNH